MTDKHPGTAFVTGAAKGIGRGIVERLAADGYRIVAVDWLEAIHQVGDSLRGRGAEVITEVIDIRDRTAIAALMDREAPLDVIVNNAAITSTHRFEDLTEDHFREAFDINVVGTFVVAQEGARRMRNGGRIINIASRSFAGAPQMAHYAASKTAVVGLTRSMAIDVEYWPTLDPTVTTGSRDQILNSYRDMRERLKARIRSRFAPDSTK